MPDEKDYEAEFWRRVVGMKFSPISLELVLLFDTGHLVVLGDSRTRKIVLPRRVGEKAYIFALSPIQDDHEPFQFAVACNRPDERFQEGHYLRLGNARNSAHHMTVHTDYPVSTLAYFKREDRLYLLYGDNDGNLGCRDIWRGGNEKWENPIWQKKVADGPILSLAVAADGTWAVAGSERPSLLVFVPTNGEEIMRSQMTLCGDFPIGPVSSLAIRKGKEESGLFYYATTKGVLGLYNAHTAHCGWLRMGSDEKHGAIVHHQDSHSTIVGGDYQNLRLFDERYGEAASRQIAAEPSVRFLDVHPFRGWLAICSITETPDGVISKVRVCFMP